jgi:hypothetical protein
MIVGMDGGGKHWLEMTTSPLRIFILEEKVS